MADLADAPLLYRFLRLIIVPLINLYLPVRGEGLENIPAKGPAILASNHLSFIDSLLIPGQVVGRQVHFFAKSDYWKSWRTRWFFVGCGTIPVERSGDGAGDVALAAGVRILESGGLIGIYPEGTRSPDGRLYKGRTGPVRMALQAGVPIIPCGIIGANHVQPIGSYKIRRHPVTIRFGSPMDLSRYRDRRDDPEALRSATDAVMVEIARLTGQERVDEYVQKAKSGEMSPSAVSTVDASGPL